MKIELFHDIPKTRPDFIRIDAGDTWSLDLTLARLIGPMLRQLKRHKQGVPGEFCAFSPDGQMAFDFIDEDEEFAHGGRRWEAALDTMIWSFDRIAEYGWDSDDIRVGDRIQMDAHHARIQVGLDLFARYYRNLWE